MKEELKDLIASVETVLESIDSDEATADEVVAYVNLQVRAALDAYKRARAAKVAK